MGELKRIVEGILFFSAEEWKAEDLAKATRRKVEAVEKALEELIAEYDKSPSVIAIRKVGPYYSMNIKKRYVDTMKKYVHAKELSKGDAKILGVIAAKPGILKSELSRKLGSHIYPIIQELVKRGFVNEVKEGRSARLFTTEKYKEYSKIYGKKEKQEKLSP
ncbi:MAG: hypothetical protein D6769_00330 [Methanobacteriota archaeon]|nr:MAG: hypothetical protein D6769_00330 [Euryarchaeota archaeon]